MMSKVILIANDALKQAFLDMLGIERSMKDSYSAIIRKTENKKVRKILRAIEKDEAEHEENVKKILKLLN